MPASLRSWTLGVLLLPLSACHSYRVASYPWQESLPADSSKEVRVHSKAGEQFRLTATHIQVDSLVGTAISQSGSREAIALNDISYLETSGTDVVKTIYLSATALLIVLVLGLLSFSSTT